MNLDDGGHLVVAGSLGFGISIEANPFDHLLHVGTLDDGIGKFTESGFAFEQQNGHAVLHAEFGLQSVLRLVMD